MPIHISCPNCRRTLRVADTAAGKRVRCPACTAVVPVPSAAAAPVQADPFAFPPQPAGQAGGDFDQLGDGPAVPRDPGWHGVRGGLGMVWWGTVIYLLAIVIGVIGLFVVLFVIGMAAADAQRSLRPEEAQELLAQAGLAGLAAVLCFCGAAALAALTSLILRIIGFARCLSVPAATGAKGMAIGCLVCEVLPILLQLCHIGLNTIDDRLGSLVGLVQLAVSVAALVFLLIFLYQVGKAIGSRRLISKVWSFLIWLGVWIVYSVVAFCGILAVGLVSIAAIAGGNQPGGQAPAETLGLGMLAILLGGVFLWVVLYLVVVVQYLGLLAVGADEVQRRAIG